MKLKQLRWHQAGIIAFPEWVKPRTECHLYSQSIIVRYRMHGAQKYHLIYKDGHVVKTERIY